MTAACAACDVIAWAAADGFLVALALLVDALLLSIRGVLLIDLTTVSVTVSVTVCVAFCFNFIINSKN